MIDSNVVLIIFKVVFIFLTSVFIPSNIYKMVFRNNISALHVYYQAIGITGLIVCYTMF